MDSPLLVRVEQETVRCAAVNSGSAGVNFVDVRMQFLLAFPVTVLALELVGAALPVTCDGV